MHGYVLDDLALQAGLTGDKRHHRELSRLPHDAIGEGTRLVVPARPHAAAEHRQPLVIHLADIIAAAPPGVLRILLLKFYTRAGRFPRGRDELPDEAVEFVARQVLSAADERNDETGCGDQGRLATSTP